MEHNKTVKRGSDERRNRFESGRFLFGLAWREKIKRKDGKSRIRIHFIWRRVFLVLAVLGVVGWLSGGTALYFYFKVKRGYEEVSWPKMLVLPLRMDAHRQEMGEFFIEKGMEEIRSGEFRPGFHKLRVGLARAPDNAEARMLLAGIFAGPLGDHQLAIKVLRDGLRFSDENPAFLESEYLDFLVRLLNRAGRGEEIPELVDSLYDSIDDPLVRKRLAVNAAAAEVRLGLLEQAYDRVNQENLTGSPEGLYLIGEILWNGGFDRFALLTLQRGLARVPASEQLASSLYHKMAELERWEELLLVSDQQRRSNAGQFASWSWYLVALESSGRQEEILPTVREILDRFADRKSFVEVMAFAAKYGYPEVAELVLDRLGHQNLQGFKEIFLGLAHLRDGFPDVTLALLGPEPKKGEENRELGASAAAVRALALLMQGKGDAAETDFQRFFQSPRHRESNFLVLAEAFSDEGFYDHAIKILKKGVGEFPQNHAMLEKLLEVGDGRLERDEYAHYLSGLLELRPPRKPELEGAAEILASDHFLFVDNQAEVFDDIARRLSRMEAFGEEIYPALSNSFLRFGSNP